ncbi:MAG: DUF2809 domain-containing protein [Capsulimonas sp.]|uniref:ribosomal maturation YjgA family protein n=1 Tax=Capsulimonas sp. TaxID=2494211 RepID=UPI0032655144
MKPYSASAPNKYRSRTLCAAAFVLTLAAGYFSRKVHLFPAALGKYPGDALWALMVYWLIVCVRPTLSIPKSALITFAISVAIEFLKLVQTPWLVAARHSKFGALIFGHVFSWNNIIAYAVGVAIGAALDYFFLRRRQIDET